MILAAWWNLCVQKRKVKPSLLKTLVLRSSRRHKSNSIYMYCTVYKFTVYA